MDVNEDKLMSLVELSIALRKTDLPTRSRPTLYKWHKWGHAIGDTVVKLKGKQLKSGIHSTIRNVREFVAECDSAFAKSSH